MMCDLCQEELGEGEPLPGGNMRAHRECLLRCVMGGIGHLEDHAHWCLKMGDPDGGRSYRQSALEVDQWLVDHQGVGT